MITQKKDRRYRQFKIQDHQVISQERQIELHLRSERTRTKRQSKTKRYPARNAIRPNLQRGTCPNNTGKKNSCRIKESAEVHSGSPTPIDVNTKCQEINKIKVRRTSQRII